MHSPILLNYSKEFIYLIIYRNNKYWQQLTLIFLLLPVTCYRQFSGIMSFPDFGLQSFSNYYNAFVDIILERLSFSWKGLHNPDFVDIILNSFTPHGKL